MASRRRVVVALFLLFVSFVALLLLPFVFFSMALKFNVAPSVALSIFHNHVYPIMIRMDDDNVYKKVWADYVLERCNDVPDKCSLLEDD